MVHRLSAMLILTAVHIPAGAALAQSAFPAPLPGQDATIGPPSAPPLSGIAPATASACMKDFIPLREDAEKKGKMIKAAGDRHAGPEESCKLIKDYSAAEVKMIEYVERNSANCGIRAQVSDQLKAGHKNTEGLAQRVCSLAREEQRRGPRGPVGDFPDGHGRF
jgi:hypothetical protein